MNARERVAWVLRDIRALPTLPHVAIQLLKQSDNPNSSLGEIAGLVETDPSVATRLLKLVNSPFFGIRRQIASVHQALLLVGMSNLRSLVLSSSVMDLFDNQGKVGSFSRAELWKHSLATGIIARKLATKTRAMDPEVAFTAGLIHDIGKVIIDRYLHAEFKEIVELMDSQHISMQDAELQVLEVSHADIGMHLSARWNLPEILRHCVAYHHSPAQSDSFQRPAALIATANSLARELNVGSGGGTEAPAGADILALATLSQEFASDLRAKLAETIESEVHEFVAPANR